MYVSEMRKEVKESEGKESAQEHGTRLSGHESESTVCGRMLLCWMLCVAGALGPHVCACVLGWVGVWVFGCGCGCGCGGGGGGGG